MSEVTRLPHPGPRPLGAIVQNVVSAAVHAKQNRDMLMAAHRKAAAFHEAIAEAMEAQDEIESANDPREVDPYWKEKFATELGKASVALKDMPVKWQAVLACELPTAPEAA